MVSAVSSQRTAPWRIRLEKQTIHAQVLSMVHRGFLKESQFLIHRHRPLKIAPKPPFFKAYLSPVNEPRWTPRARLASGEGRPACRVYRPVCGGASCTEREKSYGVQPDIKGLASSGDLDSYVMGNDIGFLVGYTSGFRRWHIGTISDRIDVVPFRL